MKKFLQRITIVFLLSVCIGLFGMNTHADMNPPEYDLNPKFTLVYENSKGDVTFNHTRHSDLRVCHVCHDGFNELGAEVNKVVGHKLCKVCHKSVGSSVAPTTCTGCHKR